MSNVNGKVIIITGASSGIGAATAKLMAKNGAKVVLGARRSPVIAFTRNLLIVWESYVASAQGGTNKERL